MDKEFSWSTKDGVINIGVAHDCAALVISENFTVYFKSGKPNAWWRFWYYVLLGWRWHDVK